MMSSSAARTLAAAAVAAAIVVGAVSACGNGGSSAPAPGGSLSAVIGSSPAAGGAASAVLGSQPAETASQPCWLNLPGSDATISVVASSGGLPPLQECAALGASLSQGFANSWSAGVQPADTGKLVCAMQSNDGNWVVRVWELTDVKAARGVCSSFKSDPTWTEDTAAEHQAQQ